MHVNATVAFTRDCARNVVANSQCAKTFAPAFAQRAEGVRGFAALADGEHQRFRRHWRVAMAKLAGVIDFGGNVCQSFDQIFADSCGVQRSSASRENDSPNVAQLRRRHVQPAQLCRAFLWVETAAHRVADCVWLLKDFFEHVMGIITLADIFGCELDFADRMLRDVAGQRTDLEFIRPGCDHVEVIQINRVARVSDDGAYIAGQKILAVADAKHERTSTPCADHEIRHVSVNQSDAVRANHLPKRRANSFKKPGFFPGDVHRAGARIVVEFPDKMREHFGVGIGTKSRITVTNELIFKRLIVFNDAVMNQRQLAAGVEVWMCVFVVNLTMRCPASVADAQ